MQHHGDAHGANTGPLGLRARHLLRQFESGYLSTGPIVVGSSTWLGLFGFRQGFRYILALRWPFYLLLVLFFCVFVLSQLGPHSRVSRGAWRVVRGRVSLALTFRFEKGVPSLT